MRVRRRFGYPAIPETRFSNLSTGDTYSAGDLLGRVTVTSDREKRDPDKICTSHIERQNLSIRMGMRRMMRLTDAFTKKRENLKAAYALWFAYYNLRRVHQSLRVTPAMEAGISNHVWNLDELRA